MQAAIEAMQIQLMPAPEDMKAVYAHGLVMMIEIATGCEDWRERRHAAEWLCTEAERQMEKREKLNQPERVREAPAELVMAELRTLYAKALPEREETPLVEVVVEGEDPQDG